jgi:hypothetical protein
MGHCARMAGGGRKAERDHAGSGVAAGQGMVSGADASVAEKLAGRRGRGEGVGRDDSAVPVTTDPSSMRPNVTRPREESPLDGT